MLKTISVTIVKEPKISAKMLCEYNESSALGRKSILKACKIKAPAIISISSRYNQAEDLISECLEHSLEYLDILKDYSKDLRKKSKTLSGKKAENTLLCAEALEQFYKMDKKLQPLFKGYVLNNTVNVRGRKIIINKVSVSIRPEVMLSIEGGTTTVGFVKLCFCKSKPLKESIAEGIASLGRMYFREIRKMDFEPQVCIVIDVFANKIFTAPKRDKRTLDALDACCAEIADRWDKI
jgi:hypothetical protein